MFDSVGWGEILVLVVAGLFILGPERLPSAAAWLGQTIRQVRQYATGAREQLRNELGPARGRELSEPSIIAASRLTRFARVSAFRSAASGLWHFLQNRRVAGLLESAVPGLARFGVSLSRFWVMSVDCGRVLSAASV